MRQLSSKFFQFYAVFAYFCVVSLHFIFLILKAFLYSRLGEDLTTFPLLTAKDYEQKSTNRCLTLTLTLLASLRTQSASRIASKYISHVTHY
jgi:hypothetical protein